MWFLAFLAFSFLLAILGIMISPIAAKAQGFFLKNRSSLCYRLPFEAFAVVEIVWLVAQGASASGSIMAGRPGPVCDRGVRIFVYVGDKTRAFGIVRWQLLLVLQRNLRFGRCSCAVERFFTVNWVVCCFGRVLHKFGEVCKISNFSVFSSAFYCIFAPLRLQIGWQLLHNRLHVRRMVQNCHVCVGFHCVLAFG